MQTETEFLQHLKDNLNIGKSTNDIKTLINQRIIKVRQNKALIIDSVVSSKPNRKSLRQIIEERRTNLCLTASILKADGKNETFFVGKYKLLDNILNEFDGIEEPN